MSKYEKHILPQIQKECVGLIVESVNISDENTSIFIKFTNGNVLEIVGEEFTPMMNFG